MNEKKKIFIAILCTSLIGNIIVLYIDIIPYIWHHVERKYFQSKTSILDTKHPEQIIIEKSLAMATSKNVTMVWREQLSFSEELQMIDKQKEWETFKRYSYPRAYLLAGLTDYAKARKDTVLMTHIAKAFNTYILNNGLPNFVFDKVDQAPFGIAAINMYQFFGNIRYKKMADYIYKKITSDIKDSSGIILYRNGDKCLINDALGMACPFLIRYQKIAKNNNPINIAHRQLEYYIKYGVDKETFLPTHGIDIKTNIKVGPTNWGRGIGWYMIALSEYTKYNKKRSNELNKLIQTLNKLRMPNHVWSQFPGSSEHFDASSTTLFMYSMNLVNPGIYTRDDIFKILGRFITDQGIITTTSGDTYSINYYSHTFGESELSQGILLMLLSTTYQNISGN